MGRPNADIVEQTKILWNDLRLKNNSKEKQRELADQLFECITGKVSEIGKKHDLAMLHCGACTVQVELRRRGRMDSESQAHQTEEPHATCGEHSASSSAVSIRRMDDTTPAREPARRVRHDGRWACLPKEK